jgi:hypothetical protein
MTRLHPRRAVLLFLCVLLAFGAAVALVADSLDGDDGFVPGCEVSALLVDATGLLRPPATKMRIHAPLSGMRAPHVGTRTSSSLRAPPSA